MVATSISECSRFSAIDLISYANNFEDHRLRPASVTHRFLTENPDPPCRKSGWIGLADFPMQRAIACRPTCGLFPYL